MNDNHASTTLPCLSVIQDVVVMVVLYCVFSLRL